MVKARRWIGGIVVLTASLTVALGGCASSSGGTMAGDPMMHKDTTMEGTTRPGMMDRKP
jgi:hypothetical protein